MRHTTEAGDVTVDLVHEDSGRWKATFTQKGRTVAYQTFPEMNDAARLRLSEMIATHVPKDLREEVSTKLFAAIDTMQHS